MHKSWEREEVRGLLIGNIIDITVNHKRVMGEVKSVMRGEKGKLSVTIEDRPYLLDPTMLVDVYR